MPDACEFFIKLKCYNKYYSCLEKLRLACNYKRPEI